MKASDRKNGHCKVKDKLKSLFRWADDLLFVFGAVCICIGVFLIYVPAGWIAIGVCGISSAVIISRWKEGDT